MSDYDILPKNLPDPTTDLSEIFSLELPEGLYGSPLKNDYSQLADDIYEILFEEALENPPPSSESATINNNPSHENIKEALRNFIQESLDKKMPELIEYHEKGYNSVRLDKNALHKLQDTLQKEALRIPELLLKPAQGFIHTLHAVVSAEAEPDIAQALPVVNTVMQHLSAALEDLSATRKVSTLNWEEESEQTAREHRKALVSQAARKLLPDDHPAAEQQATHQWLDSLLFSQSNALSAEYKKFSLLKASLMAESRITRQRLAAHLDTRAQTLLEGAREARSAALDMLLAESSPGQMSPEQLMHWSQGYQLYARYLQAIDDEPAGQAIAGNPLIAAVRASARQGGTLRARLAGAIVPLADALGAVAVWLLQEKKRTEPAPAEPQPAQRNEAGLTDTIKKVIWDRGRKKGRAVRAASAWLAKSSGSKASRAAWKTKHTLQRTPSLPENTRQAISNTALLLLDEIQQAERRIKLLPGYAWVRQEAVQQLLLLGREIADPQELPLLDELVSERLDEESARWKHVADNAAGQINALLSPLTRLAETTGFNDFYFALSDTLRANPVPGSGEAIAGMDETVIRVTEQLAELGRQLNAAAVRLSGHGHEGGKELREKAGFWLMMLKTLKTQVKTQATHLTGHAPDNFSRSGMLARGIAEWAQKLKEECLADLSGDERADAEGLFDELLMELLGEHRSHFADRRDPQAESLLKSVSVALKHAARGTTIYPPTAEEILAGTRSLPADIRHWAEKKMLTGALSAAVSGGFKLLTGPISLPVRIVLRGAKTGWTLNKHLRAMNRVRLGEGPATGSARSRLINQELSKLAFRLTLSLSPAGGYGVAATLVGSQMVRGKKGYTKALAKKVVVDLPQEALWFGLAYGGYAGVNAVVRASAERAMQNAWEEARRSERERMNRLIQQLTMADILEQKSAFGLVESTDNTDTALTVETTDEAADVPTTVDRDASKDQPAATVAEEGKTPAAANTDQSTTNKRKMPLLPPSRVKRFTPGGDTTGTGISLNSTADTHDNKLFTSQVSDSLKAMVGKLATGQAFWHEDLKNGQEGSIYNIGSKYFICINEKYWPIYIKDNKRGVITANPYTRGSKIEIEVHLDKNTWIPTAAENIKDDYPTLPVDPDSTASEGDEALKQPNNSPKGHAQSPASTASSELYNLAKVWSVYSAFYYDNMVKSKEAQIYADSNTHKTYIYLYGFYWPIIITGNSTAVIEVSDNGNGKKELINIRKIDQRWELAPTFRTNQMPEKSGGNFSIESYIKVFFNTELSSDINPDNLQAGENGLLIDKTSGFNYLLVAGYYWPVTFTLMGEFDDKEVRRIYEWGGTERLNIYYNYALGAWIPVQTTDEADDTDTSTVKNTLSADLIAKMKEWDLSSYERPANSGPGLEGEVYQDAKGRYYIYLQNHYWNFSWIKRDVGGVEVTTNGGRKLIILRKYGNEWQYFDEETVKDDFNLSTLLNDINDAKLDKETQTALESLLWNSSFTSLDNFLHELQKRLDNAFYRLYEKPFSEELSNVIYLSNRVSSLQKSLAYYYPDEDNEENQYDWNESLLALYQEEFTSEEEESSYLYTARQARNAAEEAKKRVAQFSTANIDKQLREEFEALAKRKEDWVAWLTFPSHGGPLDKAVTFTQPILESLSIKIKAHEAKIEQLTALRKQVLDRKAEYQKIIDNYNKNYRLVNMAIDFAKKAIANKKKTTGINDTLKIAESVLIDLTLQKIDVRNSAAGTDTKFEADKLKILSISKTMIAQLIERHTLSQELIKTISNTSINFPSLKNSYKDIEWSNTQAERIYKANYPDDDNPEANQLLAPLIYWLLKNKNNLNLLKSMDIDEVVDIYYADVYSLNPLQQIKKMPEGYIPLSHLLGSEYFNTDSEYYQQFITYKERYSSYEASENTKNLLLASDLSLSEITSKVKKRFYFNVLQSSDVRSKHDGAMLFIELQDGRWVFFSLFPDSLFSRVFSRQEMMGNIWLKTIANLSPEQTHYHGTESVFTESFFFKNFDPDNKNRKNRKYRTLEARKNKELKDFIDNTLYKGSDGITYNNPFKDLPYYGLTYDFSINSRQPQETLLETVNKAFHDVLNRSATNRKTVLYQTTIFNKIADILIPFYAEIRGSINDPEHKVDAVSIMLDVVGVCFVASQAGTKATTLLKNAKGIGQIIGEGTKKGLVGRGLQKYVIKEMGKQGLINAARLSKISVNALLDLVLPFDVGSLLKKTTKKQIYFPGSKVLLILACLHL